MLIKKVLITVFLLIGFAYLLPAQAQILPVNPNVTYEGPGGITLRGYLALPGDRPPDESLYGEPRLPAVLLIHEWWGLNQDIAQRAEALANEGYLVLAPDAFRGNLAQTVQEALRLVLTTPSEQISGDLAAALAYLRSREDVLPEKVATVGFCFGGTQAMYLGTSHPELTGVVIFYGNNPITDPERLGSMAEAGPVLGIFGAKDNNIPLEQVRAFEMALQKKGVKYIITIYPDVGHAFLNSENYNRGGAPEEAWRQMLRFLEQNLKK
jgi:carboxymethylenebutenolidase